jgi:hypothetical protein
MGPSGPFPANNGWLTCGIGCSKQICAVDRNMRQTFKDCCKGLKQESVIGHCR